MNDEILASALESMPVFPLPAVVLFPGALMPLHIFEPRYRTMLADSLATNRCLAMGFIIDGSAEGLQGAPRVARVAGVGSIVHHAPLPDGRSNIVLKGRARVWLDELPFVPPFRRARARILDDVPTPVSNVERTGLVAAAAACAAACGRPDFELPGGIAPGEIADLCAHQLVADPTARQRTLEELDIAARVRLVTAALAEQMGMSPRSSRGKPD
jgi:Lon protease-like protein